MDSAGSNITEAVLFLNEKGVSKEMLFPEFESILDNIVGLNDCKNQEMKAVFVKITAQLTITATVFFLIKFDEHGMADTDWNMPLRHLADTTPYVGPDIGAGAVRLACRSQCDVEWLESQLWDPDISEGKNSFTAIRDAIKRNRLGLLYAPGEETAAAASTVEAKPAKSKTAKADSEAKQATPSAVDVAAATQQLQAQHQKAIAEIEGKQKLYLATLENRYKREFDKLHGDYQADLQTYKNQLAKAKQFVEQQSAKFEKTLATLQEQLQQAQIQRQQLEENLTVSAQDKEKLELLKQQYEADVSAQLEAQRTDLLEQLELREIELAYRQQQEQQLKQAIDKIRNEKIELLMEGGDNYLNRLNKSGVVFVAYQPGSGHLTIPLSHMGRYIDDPLAYVAEKTGLAVDHYKAWLMHYNNPVCIAKLVDGSRCTTAVKQVLAPNQFIPGEHDHCVVHRPLAPTEAT